MPKGDGENAGKVIAGLGSLVGAGVSAVGNALSNKKQNKRSREHEIEMWHMQNAYNDPQAQMQRLKMGGLNPNLVYGQSSGAAAGNASSPNSPKFYANDFTQAGNATTTAINTYYDTEVKKAQTDNLKADNTVKIQEALLKAAQTQNTGASTKKSQSETEILDSIKQYSGEAAKANLDQTKAQIDSTITDTERKQALHSRNMEQAMYNIIKTKVGNKLTEAQIKKAIADTDLAQQEAELAKEGIYKGDPLWLRYLMQNQEAVLEKLKGFKMPSFKLW